MPKESKSIVLEQGLAGNRITLTWLRKPTQSELSGTSLRVGDLLLSFRPDFDGVANREVAKQVRDEINRFLRNTREKK